MSRGGHATLGDVLAPAAGGLHHLIVGSGPLADEPIAEDDGIASLADTLLKAEAIPESVRDQLFALQRRFQGTNTKADELAATNDWILSFLNEYLGGQILILN